MTDEAPGAGTAVDADDVGEPPELGPGDGWNGEGGPGYVHQFGTDVSPSTGVVMAVAAVTGRSATSLVPLYQAIDPDALDRLVGRGGARDGGRPVRVTFQYEDATVAVDSSGTVHVVGGAGSGDG